MAFKHNAEKLACQRAWRHKNPTRMKAYQQRYRKRVQNWQRLDRKRNPERYRAYKFKQRYGITLADKARMYEAQAGLCAICRTRKAVHLDHNQRTHKVRGLLCQQCNHALGLMQENCEWLQTARLYIKANS